MKRTIFSLLTVSGLMLSGCGGKVEEVEKTPIISIERDSEEVYPEVERSVPEIKAVHPSDSSLFTQALEVRADGELLLGTGLYGESMFGVMDLIDGEMNVIDSLDEKYFGEGFTQTEDYFWHLTWREQTAFKRDVETYEVLEEINYEGEGWGLAYDVDLNVLYMSDGSEEIQVRDPETFELKDTFAVTLGGVLVSELNELEYADGKLYSNVWYETEILEINPKTGQVTHVYDIQPLLAELNLTAEQVEQMDSLNGIAYIEESRFYITGKNYPVILEVILK